MGCGRTTTKRELLRLAIVEGAVVRDEQARLPGRGAYVCRRPECLAAATHRGLRRAFRQPVIVDPDRLESVA